MKQLCIKAKQNLMINLKIIGPYRRRKQKDDFPKLQYKFYISFKSKKKLCTIYDIKIRCVYSEISH